MLVRQRVRAWLWFGMWSLACLVLGAATADHWLGPVLRFCPITHQLIR